MARATALIMPPEEYSAEQQRRLDRLDAALGEDWLDRPFIYRAHVAPDLPRDRETAPTRNDSFGMRGECSCGWRGKLHATADHEAARAEAIAHVKTHEHRVDSVRVFGVDK